MFRACRSREGGGVGYDYEITEPKSDTMPGAVPESIHRPHWPKPFKLRKRGLIIAKSQIGGDVIFSPRLHEKEASVRPAVYFVFVQMALNAKSVSAFTETIRSYVNLFLFFGC